MTTTNEKSDLQLGKAIRTFAENLTSLRRFLALVDSFLSEQTIKYVREQRVALIPIRLAMAAIDSDPKLTLTEEQDSKLRDEFGSEVKLIIGPESKTCNISIEGKSGKQFRDAVDGLSSRVGHQKLLTRNCLISLISSAEWFLSQVLRGFFEANHDSAAIKEKTLTLDDLRKIGSIEDAEGFLIAGRVDEIMWGGYEDWIKYLRTNVRLSMGYLEEDEASLVEVFQRRHLLVHNDGVVNQSYLSKVPEHMRKNARIGEHLPVESDYVLGAISLIERNFLLIAAELWKKLRPKEEERASILTDLTIEALVGERYKVAEAASRFITNDKQLPERSQIIGQLNFWQTKKWDGSFESVKREVEEADFSAKDELYQLARLVLLDQFDDAVPVIEDQLKREKLGLKSLEEWPIFKEIRKDPRIIALIGERRNAKNEDVQFPMGAIDAPAVAAIKEQDKADEEESAPTAS